MPTGFACTCVSLLCVYFSGTPEVVVCASYYPLQPHNNSFGLGQMVCLFSIPPLLLVYENTCSFNASFLLQSHRYEPHFHP